MQQAKLRTNCKEPLLDKSKL